VNRNEFSLSPYVFLRRDNVLIDVFKFYEKLRTQITSFRSCHISSSNENKKTIFTTNATCRRIRFTIYYVNVFSIGVTWTFERIPAERINFCSRYDSHVSFSDQFRRRPTPLLPTNTRITGAGIPTDPTDSPAPGVCDDRVKPCNRFLFSRSERRTGMRASERVPSDGHPRRDAVLGRPEQGDCRRPRTPRHR